MKKVIILTLMLILISSSLVFATTYPEQPDSRTKYIIVNDDGYTKLFTSTDDLYLHTGYSPPRLFGVTGYSATEYRLSSDGLTWNFYTGWIGTNYFATFQSTDILNSSYTIYSNSTLSGTPVFTPPPQPFQEGMAGALPNLLQSLLVILPIILGMLVLVIGFRKAWEMLSRVLARA